MLKGASRLSFSTAVDCNNIVADRKKMHCHREQKTMVSFDVLLKSGTTDRRQFTREKCVFFYHAVSRLRLISFCIWSSRCYLQFTSCVRSCTLTHVSLQRRRWKKQQQMALSAVTPEPSNYQIKLHKCDEIKMTTKGSNWMKKSGKMWAQCCYCCQL